MTEPLKPPKEYRPEFMEKYTSFISKHSWQNILKISEKMLIQLGCECKTENFSIDCIFYNEQHCVNMPFRVNIFTSADSDDEYVVEFQKRHSGDTLEFLDLFAQFIKQNERCGMVSRSKTEATIFPKPRPIPFDSSSNPIILNKDCLDLLLHQLKSKRLKVQVEGLSVLAKCVQTKANCVLMRRDPSTVSLLCSLLDTDYSKITYPTLIILKFLLNPSNGSQLKISKIVSLLNKDPGETYKNLIDSVIHKSLLVE